MAMAVWLCMVMYGYGCVYMREDDKEGSYGHLWPPMAMAAYTRERRIKQHSMVPGVGMHYLGKWCTELKVLRVSGFK